MASKEGIFGGSSSGANVSAAIELLKAEMKGILAIMVCGIRHFHYSSLRLEYSLIESESRPN